MTRTKSLAIAMYLGAALAGATIALAVDRMVPSSGNTRPRDTGSFRTRFFDELKLTPAQRDSAGTMLDERERKYKALMEQRRAILEPVRAAQDSIEAEWRQRFTQLLTSEQKAIYDQMQAARRERSARGGRGNDR
ncbi:MAG: hypothetical protein FJ202_00295 [Gemmatimonadetes bacterium]|nr:hypothetical protein [Gemmatimonadota bacterium]